MIAHRRTEWNFALERAVDWARALKKPLVVFEPLRCDYEWNCDRFHQFVIQGMADNARRLAKKPVLYYPFAETKRGGGKALLAALAKQACVVISDDFPCFFLPHMIAAASRQIPVHFELVDSNGILPIRATNKYFSRAFDFRRFLQRELTPHLAEFPKADPLARVRIPKLAALPSSITRKWPAAEVEKLAANPAALAKLPIDHEVVAVTEAGGAVAGNRRLRQFLDHQLASYGKLRNEPEQEATSGLSTYLHFGHISPHQVFVEVMGRAKWSPAKISGKVTGSTTGWWGATTPAEAFVDQLITWRELGFNSCVRHDSYDKYESLPDWAQKTLADHAKDRREHKYSLQQFEAAETHNPLWNAAQRQLVREGRIHNYLRMVWGKKILHWSGSPREALDIMIELNNKYAIDGRDPNSYSGIFWILGRYDRAWGPERPVFGKIRYMSSRNTAKKFRVAGYLAKYGPAE